MNKISVLNYPEGIDVPLNKPNRNMLVIFKDEDEIRFTGVELGFWPVRERDDFQAPVNG